MSEILLHGGGALNGVIKKTSKVLHIKSGRMFDDFKPIDHGVINLGYTSETTPQFLEYQKVLIIDDIKNVIGFREIPVYSGSLYDWVPNDGVFQVIDDLNDTGEANGTGYEGFRNGDAHPLDPRMNGLTAEVGDGFYCVTRYGLVNQYEHTIKFKAIFYNHIDYASYYYVGPILRSKTQYQIEDEEILNPTTANFGTLLGYAPIVHRMQSSIDLYGIRFFSNVFNFRFGRFYTGFGFLNNTSGNNNGDIFEAKIVGNKIYMKKNNISLVAMGPGIPYGQTWIDLGNAPITGSKVGMIVGRWHFQMPMAQDFEASWPSSSCIEGKGSIHPYTVYVQGILNGGGVINSIAYIKRNIVTASLTQNTGFSNILLRKTSNLIGRIHGVGKTEEFGIKRSTIEPLVHGGGILNRYFISKINNIVNRYRRLNGLS